MPFPSDISGWCSLLLVSKAIVINCELLCFFTLSPLNPLLARQRQPPTLPSSLDQKSLHFFDFYGYFAQYLKAIVIKMSQSEKFLKLQKMLTSDPNIKALLKTTLQVAQKYPYLGSQSFLSYDDLQLLAQEVNRLRVPQINQMLGNLKIPHSIVAFPIHKTQKFTLFFVIVPPNKKFDWHSHPKMAGISKCFHGHLKISTIDLQQLQPYTYNTHLYPKNRMRFQSIKYSDEQTVAIIEPNIYNVHKIEAVQLSAFFDLLIPDYPDNTCQFFKTIDENQENLLLQQLQAEEQEILGWDVYYEQLLKGEKHIIKNYILK